MEEAELVGNPSNRFTSFPCSPEAVPGAPNGAAPTYYIDARAGWTSEFLNTYPGWSVWYMSGGGGSSIQLGLINNGLFAPNPCNIRETGLSYVRWPYAPDSMLKSNSYRLGEFNSVNATFTASVPYSAGPPKCSSFPTAYISADFHVLFENAKKEVVQENLLGVLLYVQPGTTVPPAPNAVFWQNATGQQKILLGERVSPAIPQMTPGGSPVNYSINYRRLVEEYVTPPLGYSDKEAVVGGLDVYSSVRGSDLDLYLSNVDLVGVN